MCSFRRAKRDETGASADASIESEAWLVLAVGNPGRQYANSRHNVGWWVADEIVKRAGAKLTAQGICDQAEVRLGETAAVVAYPKTYVNRSGAAARTLLDRTGIPIEHMLVICDDINLPVGTIRVRRKGGAGGHNGLASIIDSIGSDAFPRIRVGVGKQSEGTSQVDHVLGAPSKSEAEQLNQEVKRAADAATTLITESVEAAMNRYNQRPSADQATG